MTRVDFYTLDPGYRGDRLGFACRLIEKIRARGLRVLVHCPDSGEAQSLDRRLWSFREDSFIPHGRVGQVDATLTPVLISPNGEPATEQQVLINLALEAPAFFARFARLCELLDQRPEVLEAGRQRWKWYQQQGCPLAHHRIGA
jgi:DNA polymerase-3 subunit chi